MKISLQSALATLLFFCADVCCGQGVMPLGKRPELLTQISSGAEVVAKSAIAKPRLISAYFATRQVAAGGVYPTDSFVYFWSHGRGGDLTSEPFSCDSAYELSYNSATAAYSLRSIYRNTFNTNGWIDTNEHLGANGLGSDFRYVYSFTSAGKVTTLLSQTRFSGGWQNDRLDTNAYLANGNIDSILSFLNYTPSSGKWAYMFVYKYAYNLSGAPLSMVVYAKNGSSAPLNNTRYTVSYNAVGDTTSWTREEWIHTGSVTPHWQFSWQHRYYYPNGVGNFHSIDVFDSSNTGSRQPQDSIITAQTAGAMPNKVSIYYRWNAGAWALTARSTSSFNAAGNPATILDEAWNGAAWVSNQHSFYFYNSYDQLAREYSETWQPATGTWGKSVYDFENRYYYEQYTPSAVQNVSPELQIGISPNPADGQLCISFPMPIRNLSIYIVDINGSVIYRLKEQASTISYTRKIDTKNFPSGNYFIDIYADGEHELRKLTVTH